MTRRLAADVALAGAGVVLLALFSSVAPYNMDEFIHYDALLCHLYPGNALFGECDPFRLDLLGTGWVLPLRAYDYSGSLPALYYLPLHVLFGSPLVARFLNVGMLCASAAIAGRCFGLRDRVSVPLALLAFPLFFQHAVDTGPVAPHVLGAVASYALLRRWIATGRWRYPLSAGLVAFLCVWTKFSFFWLLPGIAGGYLTELWRQRGWRRLGTVEHWMQGVVFAALPALLMLPLLLSTAPGDPAARPYLDALTQSRSYALAELPGALWESNVTRSLLRPLEATHRLFVVADAPMLSTAYAIVAYLFVPVSLILLSFARPRKGAERKARDLATPAALYLLFLGTVAMIVRTKDAGLMHHAILSYAFLLPAAYATVAQLLAAKRAWLRNVLFLWCVAFVAVNGAFFGMFWMQPLHHHDRPEKLLAHAIATSREVSREYAVVVVDWGMYYYSGLFGSPNGKAVAFEWGLDDPERLRELRDAAAERGKKLLFLYTTQETAADVGMLRGNMELVDCAVLRGTAWEILAEPGSLSSACDAYAKAPWLWRNPFARMLLTLR